MSFLNKKSWHTGGMPMLRKVWAAEEREKEEQRTIAQLRKEKAEERAVEDSRRLQAQQGLLTATPGGASGVDVRGPGNERGGQAGAVPAGCGGRRRSRRRTATAGQQRHVAGGGRAVEERQAAVEAQRCGPISTGGRSGERGAGRGGLG